MNILFLNSHNLIWIIDHFNIFKIKIRIIPTKFMNIFLLKFPENSKIKFSNP